MKRIELNKILRGVVYAVVLLCAFYAPPPVRAQDFIVGGDISSLRAVVDNGDTYSDSTQDEPLPVILKRHGFNWFRLKLWHTPYTDSTADPANEKPADPYNDLPRVVQTAVEGKARGLKFLLDFHYSDTWADPGRQYKPEAWANITKIDTLADSLYNYTLAVMTTLRDAGAMPDMVQLGNEINSGMLWPEGNPYNGGSWDNLGELLRAGVQAVRDSELPGDSGTVKIMIHHADGSAYFYSQILAQGVHVDYFGRSYYPRWHGTLTDLENNLTSLANQFTQGIIVVETAYQWTTAGNQDGNGNVLGTNNLLSGFPASVAGQKKFLIEVRSIVQNLPNGHGSGVFYWEPAWLPHMNGYGSPMENATLFDFNGNALASIDALATDISQMPSSNLTLRFNSSTVGDTLRPQDLMVLLGEVKGYTGNTLSDGRTVSWGKSTSQLYAQNIGGDYWTITIPLIVGDTLRYQVWTGRSLSEYGNYEHAVIPANGADGKTRIAVAGEADTTFPLEYVNGTTGTVDQYWRPYPTDPDSVVVAYRVNMLYQMLLENFIPDDGDQVAVYREGSPTEPTLLTRETNSIGGGALWSGAFRIPRSELTGGYEQSYRFAILPQGMNIYYEYVDRSFSLSESFAAEDTTLHWVYFNNLGGDAVEDEPVSLPRGFAILTAHPNPFNGEIQISYTLSRGAEIRLAVYNLLGRRVRTLSRAVQSAGIHRAPWDGRDERGNVMPSGVYIVRLTTPGGADARRITLVR